MFLQDGTGQPRCFARRRNPVGGWGGIDRPGQVARPDLNRPEPSGAPESTPALREFPSDRRARVEPGEERIGLGKHPGAVVVVHPVPGADHLGHAGVALRTGRGGGS